MSIADAVPVLNTCSAVKALFVPVTLTWLVLVSLPPDSEAVVPCRFSVPALVTCPPEIDEVSFSVSVPPRTRQKVLTRLRCSATRRAWATSSMC